MKLEDILGRYRRALACLPDDVPVGRLTRLQVQRGWQSMLDYRPEHRWWRSEAVDGYVFESLSVVLVGGGLLAHAVAPRDDTPASGFLGGLGFPVEGGTLRKALEDLPPGAVVDYLVWYRHETCRAHGALRFRSDEMTILIPPTPSLPPPDAP